MAQRYSYSASKTTNLGLLHIYNIDGHIDENYMAIKTN